MKRLLVSFLFISIALISCKNSDNIVTPKIESLSNDFKLISISVSGLNIKYHIKNTSQVPYGGPSSSSEYDNIKFTNISIDLSKSNGDSIKTVADTIFGKYNYYSGNYRSFSSIAREGRIVFDLQNGKIKYLLIQISSSSSNSTSPGGPSSSSDNFQAIGLKDLPYQKSGDTLIVVSIKGTEILNLITNIGDGQSSSSSSGVAGGNGSGSNSSGIISIESATENAAINLTIKR